MLELILYISIVIASMYILIKSADYLISSASTLGQRAGINKLVIGLTLIAIGTSLPELFTAVFGIYTSNSPSSFVFGTIIGSNIANTLLVFGILLIFANKFKSNLKKFDIFFLILSTLLLTLIILNSELTRLYGIIMIILFVIYIYQTIKFGKSKELITDVKEEVDELEDDEIAKKNTLFVSIIFILSIIGLNLSARGVVLGIENIGILLLIPIEYLTLTTVAFATSLPEVIVTINTAKRKDYEIGIGNIVGSNISNILLIVGTAGVLKPMIFESSKYLLSMLFLIVATVIFIFLINKKNVNKIHGAILFTMYCIYVIYTFI
ncbi:MAG: calcium/sodium antiporter [Candidatus Woesearchaeota archaeon]|jgi:cation:H+ antiporter|nr:calcium/sodium antiporter [Candidatus Woesearchaeota archaeon]